MATARRRSQPPEQDLYGPAKPAAWLSPQELAESSVQEQHRIAAARRKAVTEEYAREHRMLVADVERRFLVHPDHKFTDRREALRRLAEHPSEPSGLDIRARRVARLVASRTMSE